MILFKILGKEVKKYYTIEKIKIAKKMAGLYNKKQVNNNFC
jgi:homoserine trans-succinylase